MANTPRRSGVHLPAERPKLWQGAPTLARTTTGRLDTEVLSTTLAGGVLDDMPPVDATHILETERVEAVTVIAD